MILKTDKIAELLRAREEDPLIIVPEPVIDMGAGAVDLRLGTWFLTFRHTRIPLQQSDDKPEVARQLAKMHYVPFGEKFYLHPRSFVLGITLEWIRLKRNLVGIVTGKSSLGRCGLIIATATGVHPGFTGCLTLELTNLGEIPIAIEPGMQICQLFLHWACPEESQTAHKSAFNAQTRPTPGQINIDDLARKLSSKSWKVGEANQGQ